MTTRLESDTEDLCTVWEATGGLMWAKARVCIRNWIELLGRDEVEDAIILSSDRRGVDRYRYFNGICRNKQNPPVSWVEVPVHRQN